MSPDPVTQAVVRKAIQEGLASFAKAPFFDLRERDPQARLLLAVRARLSPPEVPVRLVAHRSHARHQLGDAVRTSRAHTEMKVGGVIVDLAVFRADTEVELRVAQAGALDVIAPIRGEDLAAIVEVKAAPSSNQHPTFVEDLRRLDTLIAQLPGCAGFFVLFDKSLELLGAASKTKPKFEWLNHLRADPSGRLEAHWVDVSGRSQSRVGVFAP